MFFPRYFNLRNKMKQCGIKVNDLAAALDLSPTVMSKKLNGRTPWRLDECYKVLDLLKVPREKMNNYFPAADVEVEIPC